LSFPKILLYGSFVLFASIGIVSVMKGQKKDEKVEMVAEKEITEVLTIQNEQQPQEEVKIEEKVVTIKEDDIPQADIIDRLFVTDSSKLPFVETITYTSRVPWLKGRPAWIADYASYYETTRHFIARSLNKNDDYFTQKISPGDRFNVIRKDKNISFYLLIDISRSKLFFYALDKDLNSRYLLKTYNVGLGRKNVKKESGYLTPTGKYTLGSKVAIYKPGTMGYFQDRKIEMIRVFGTRWIPFDKEVENCSDISKGYGLHGCPWINKAPTGELIEDVAQVGQYDSDGCIRLYSKDVEEIFSIVISKPTVVEIVKDFSQASLPCEEVEIK
jgi:hypothetical protein